MLFYQPPHCQDPASVPAWSQVALQQPLRGGQVWWWVPQALQLHQRLHSRGTRSSRCHLLPPHRCTAKRKHEAENKLVAPSALLAALSRFYFASAGHAMVQTSAVPFFPSCCSSASATPSPRACLWADCFDNCCHFRFPTISQPRGMFHLSREN